MTSNAEGDGNDTSTRGRETSPDCRRTETVVVLGPQDGAWLQCPTW